MYDFRCYINSMNSATNSKRIDKMETLTHRRDNDNIDTGYVKLFAEEGNEHYGDHVWTLKSELPRASKCEELISFCAEFYKVDEEEAEELVDPDDIVSTAGAWDDPQFVFELWNAMEYNKVKEVAGYRTYDGAVVIDHLNVKLDYCLEVD